MKYFILILLSVAALNATSQKSYSEVLGMTKEIKVIDRLYLDIPNLDKTEIDAATAYKFFGKAYVSNGDLPHDTKYYISGKITKHPDFDLLFLYAEKSIFDTLKNFELLLLTTRKDGTQISMIEAASYHYYIRNGKIQFNKSRSYLYRGFKIKQENEISVMNKKHKTEYRINDYGVFVFYPNYAKN